MVRELYQRLREYFNNLPEPTEEEKQFIRELNAGDFPSRPSTAMTWKGKVSM